MLSNFEICCRELRGLKVTSFRACVRSFCSVEGPYTERHVRSAGRKQPKRKERFRSRLRCSSTIPLKKNLVRCKCLQLSSQGQGRGSGGQKPGTIAIGPKNNNTGFQSGYAKYMLINKGGYDATILAARPHHSLIQVTPPPTGGEALNAL